MRKHLLALLLAACLLTGCAARTAVPTAVAMPDIGGGLPYPTAQPALDSFWPPASQGRTALQRAYGSAGLLGWPSVLVSVYLDEEDGAVWTDDGIAQSREKLRLAVQWITDQCAAYRAHPAIRYDDGTPDSGLFFHETYPGRFTGGEESEGDEYLDAMDMLCSLLDTDELHERYGTSSVGFLFFLPVDGVSFTMVHYLEDGSDFYHEYCTLYQYDTYSSPGTPETPAVFAHEILHLFGAPDLYAGSSDVFVTDELSAYAQSAWPHAIMLDTYAPGGALVYDRIDKQLSPLTAYRLGLTPTFAELDRFPDAGAFAPGTFTGDLETVPLYSFNDGTVAA